MIPKLMAAAVTALALLWPAAVLAADTEKFSTTCLGAEAFLLDGAPEGIDKVAVLTSVCGCLVTEFADFSQAEIDVLTTDLDGTATAESHAAFGDYAALEGKAGNSLNTCFSTQEVNDLLGAPDAAAPTVQ